MSDLIAQAEAIAVEVQFMRDTATALDAANLPEGAAAVRNTAIAVERHAQQLRAQFHPFTAHPVATLYVGSEWGQELQDWEIEANQKVCERLNEQHAGNPTTLNLYATPDPRISELEGLLRECLPTFFASYIKDRVLDEDLPDELRAHLERKYQLIERIEAALKEG